jgi:hypothetical protein
VSEVVYPPQTKLIVVISPLMLFEGKNARNKDKHVTMEEEKKGGTK